MTEEHLITLAQNGGFELSEVDLADMMDWAVYSGESGDSTG